MTLETDLKRALRRQQPPAGFAGRVLERIEAEAQHARIGPPIGHRWWRAAAASVTLAAVLGGYATHKVFEYRRGMHAKAQVVEAIRIAGEKVRYAQEQVRDIGSHD